MTTPSTEIPVPVAQPAWKDILIRAGKTFVQGATGAAGALVVVEILDPTGINLDALQQWALSFGVGGLSAVVSYLWNTLVQWANS